ncbi:MAG: relaxase domain-containing protein [Phycisphaerales bacterium]|nr:relaxase domain-containing protein [Phycisphaerales bacterium]
MLRIIQNQTPAGAKSYYSTADYYTEGQELQGRWRGHGAERLGLGGTVCKDQWDALCDNRRPDTGGVLTPRQKTNRRVGYDFNFHVPKSVSLLYAMSGDDRILDAFREAVDATMQEMEAEAKARVRRKGSNEDRVTGNLVWGEFVHLTARPEGGVPDPHLHAHCFVFNATFDPEEGRWKAAQLGDLKRDAPYFEAVFHSRLARGLEELGLATERTAKGWEVGGIEPQTLASFSRRTARIEKTARDRGVTDPVAKAELGAKTRSGKAKELGMPELKALWRSRLNTQEAATIDSLAERLGGTPIEPDAHAAAQSVDRAMAHCFERASVVPERVLLAEALRQGTGRATREAVEHQAAARPLVRAARDGRRLVTTREVLEEETTMLALARDARGRWRPMSGPRAEWTRDWLNAEQRAAVGHVLASRDGVIIIRGVAGAGKTSALQELREAVEQAGTRVFAFAPSAEASRGELRRSGFETADTVARLLLDERMQGRARGSLLVIDEAGLLGTKTMRSALELAERTESRVLLVGDSRQHSAVERGSALRMLETEAGLRPAEIKEIQRQRGQYKQAVKDLSEGNTTAGMQRLDALGWVREIPAGEREATLARAYLETVQAGETALVVSPSHAEGDRITAEIRGQLRQAGALAGCGRELMRLVPAHLTLGQRRDPASYQRGDVLVFHQNARGHRRGQRIAVAGQPLPLDQAERFGVFRRSRIELFEGDRIRITQNGVTPKGNHRVNTGDVFTVKAFTKAGDLVLDNGWELPGDYGHLSYGQVVTSHASQGRTVDRVFVAQSSMSFAASSKAQFYVSVSRGRKQAVVFTDNKHELLEAVNRSDDRLSATELAAEAVRERARRQQQEANLAPDWPAHRPPPAHELEPAHAR